MRMLMNRCIGKSRARIFRISSLATVMALVAFAMVAMPRAHGQALQAYYELNDTYADALGGPPLSPDGGTLGPTGYTFAPNQGLNVAGALPDPGNYSILLDFEFSNVAGFRKVIDFKDRTADHGLYTNGPLVFISGQPGGSGITAFTANTLRRVVLTRDGGTGQVTGYLDGAQEFTIADPANAGVFTVGGLIRLFEDDAGTGFNEASGGFVDRVAFFNGPLTASQVAVLAGPGTEIPEPTAALLAAPVLLLLRRRRRE